MYMHMYMYMHLCMYIPSATPHPTPHKRSTFMSLYTECGNEHFKTIITFH